MSLGYPKGLTKRTAKLDKKETIMTLLACDLFLVLLKMC